MGIKIEFLHPFTDELSNLNLMLFMYSLGYNFIYLHLFCVYPHVFRY